MYTALIMYKLWRWIHVISYRHYLNNQELVGPKHKHQKKEILAFMTEWWIQCKRCHLSWDQLWQSYINTILLDSFWWLTTPENKKIESFHLNESLYHFLQSGSYSSGLVSFFVQIDQQLFICTSDHCGHFRVKWHVQFCANGPVSWLVILCPVFGCKTFPVLIDV